MRDPDLVIASHKGPYSVYFDEKPFEGLTSLENIHFIIDSKVAKIHADALRSILKSPSVLLIEATEDNKDLSQMPKYIEHLVQNKVRKNHTLIAIGGGIIQDTTCFLASVLFRGMQWVLYPTTLLAQADSGIGSKSSINCGGTKNLVGTFYPPQNVRISTTLLKSLEAKDIRSGIGEMLKVHIIDGTESFRQIAQSYDALTQDESCLMDFIRRSLLIKKKIIEIDEFDQGIRNILNYGHSFGHAIEAATEFGVPHGIAVTMGMDLANFMAYSLSKISDDEFKNMHAVLAKNYAGFERTTVPLELFNSAIGKDKKNIGANLGLILPKTGGGVEKVFLPADEKFLSICTQFFNEIRTT